MVILSVYYDAFKWSPVLNGIGTGLITSLVVSIIINKSNDAREKREKEIQKRYLLNGIIESSLDVYEDVLYRINAYITIMQVDIKPIYELYNDFKPFKDFANYIKTISIGDLSEKESKQLKKLFNFRNYRIDYLIAELNHLPKQEYFLQGILSKEECSKLLSNAANDAYMNYAKHIDEFWENDEIYSIEKCIQFLHMTIYICSNTISSFDFAKIRAQEKEKDLEKLIEQLYYEEVYCNSDECIEEQIERSNSEAEYYANHPEELQKQYEEWESETEEERKIKDLYDCIYGWSFGDIDELLSNIDVNSPNFIRLIQNKETKKELRNKDNKEIRKAIKRKIKMETQNNR